MERPLRALLIAVVLPSAPALAQTRPLLAEEALIGTHGRLALETGLDFMAGERNFITGNDRDRWDGPSLRLIYSPSDAVEIDLEWVAWIATPSDPDLGSVGDFGDVSLRTKVRFRRAGPRSPAIAGRYTLTLPETSYGEGLGPNTLRMSAQLLLSQPAGRVWLHGNLGVAIEDEPQRAHEQRDLLAFGVAVEGAVTPQVTVLAEVAGKSGKGAPGADERIEARAGVRLTRDRWSLDAAVRRGLAEADGTWGVTAGLGLRLSGNRGGEARE